MLKLGWFSTGRGPGSRNLLREVMERKDDGTLDVEFSFVFCNWDNTEEPNPKKDQRQMFFDMVEGYGIPLITLSWKTFRPDLWDSDPSEWRRLYGIEIRKRIQDLGFDLGILAGYMLWIDDETCEQYDFMNLHPALPTGPKGTWQEVIWQLIREGADEQGAMMHIVTPEWDRGTALTYCRFPIRGKGYDELWADLDERLKDRSLDDIIDDIGIELPLFKKIREDGAKHELPLIVETIRQFADGNVHIKEKNLYKGDTRLEGPFDLSEQVDKNIEG
ncbi:phosphoribosylglycinamide formyltransferase [Candidatus Methanarcanum hacksteinii]|uniref:phosphoribosylglycinamide formyltransferase n=1 Tax=Candidatus Methanarcanum hacksteinii TaxID=2911857 RepID=UPI0037DDB11F